MTPEDMLARVLYRDGLMLVIDKPAGLPVHRGPKGGGSLEDYFDALRYGLPRPPALAHRLDRETSGCLVLGRHRKALAHLGLLFKHGKVGKTYWAVVEGGPKEESGVIDLPLGRLDQTRGWWMKPDPDGLPSMTKWRVLGRSVDTSASAAVLVTSSLAGNVAAAGRVVKPVDSLPAAYPPPQPSPMRGKGARPWTGEASARTGLTWLALEPLTGRTHQLRVHCAAQGWPIVGDAIYGGAPRFHGPGLQLHAREIAVPLSKGRVARVTAPVPAHMAERLAACGWSGSESATIPDAQASEREAG